MLHLRRGLCSILVLLTTLQCFLGELCLADDSIAIHGIEVEYAEEPLTSLECFAYLDEQDSYMFTDSQPGVVHALLRMGRRSSTVVVWVADVAWMLARPKRFGIRRISLRKRGGTEPTA